MACRRSAHRTRTRSIRARRAQDRRSGPCAETRRNPRRTAWRREPAGLAPRPSSEATLPPGSSSRSREPRRDDAPRSPRLRRRPSAVVARSFASHFARGHPRCRTVLRSRFAASAALARSPLGTISTRGGSTLVDPARGRARSAARTIALAPHSHPGSRVELRSHARTLEVSRERSPPRDIVIVAMRPRGSMLFPGRA